MCIVTSHQLAVDQAAAAAAGPHGRRGADTPAQHRQLPCKYIYVTQLPLTYVYINVPTSRLSVITLEEFVPGHAASGMR